MAVIGKHNQRFLWVYREGNTDYEDVTDYVSGEWKNNYGDVSGVGEQGNDGVAGIASFRLVNTNTKNFNPTISYGVRTYTRETLVGGSSNYTLSNGFLINKSATVYSSTQPYSGNITITNNYTSGTTEAAFSPAIASGNTVTIQYMYFDKTSKNSINWHDYDDGSGEIEDVLLQSNRYVRFVNRNGDLNYARETITGDGSDAYTFTTITDGSTADAGRVVSKVSIFGMDDWDDYTSEISLIQSGGIWYYKFKNGIANGEEVILQFSYNSGADRTTFYGLLGDRFSYDMYGITCQCRDENKILQSTPIIFDADQDLVSKFTPTNKRIYDSADLLIAEGVTSNNATNSIITVGSGSFLSDGVDQIFDIEISKTILLYYNLVIYVRNINSYISWDSVEISSAILDNTNLTTVYYNFHTLGSVDRVDTGYGYTVIKYEYNIRFKTPFPKYRNEIVVFNLLTDEVYECEVVDAFVEHRGYFGPIYISSVEIDIELIENSDTWYWCLKSDKIEYGTATGTTISNLAKNYFEIGESVLALDTTTGETTEGLIQDVSVGQITLDFDTNSTNVNIYAKNQKGYPGWMVSDSCRYGANIVQFTDPNKDMEDYFDVGDYCLIGSNAQLPYKITSVRTTYIVLDTKIVSIIENPVTLWKAYKYGIPIDVLIENTFLDFLGEDNPITVKNQAYPIVKVEYTVNSNGSSPSTLTLVGTGDFTDDIVSGNWIEISDKKYVVETVTATEIKVASRGCGDVITGTGLTMAVYPGNLNINYNEINVDWWGNKNLKTFATNLVSQNGQYEGFCYEDESALSQYTIFNIDRENIVKNRTLSFETDFNKQDLSYTDNNYRDAVIVYYLDAFGEKQSVSYPSQQLATFSQPMIVAENLTAGITTVGEATKLAENIYSDVSSLTLQQSKLEMPLDVQAELFEYVEYIYPYMFNENQTFATDSLEHNYITQKTTKSVSNKRKGGVNKWRKYEAQPGRYQPILANNLSSASKLNSPKGLATTEGTIIYRGRDVYVQVPVTWKKPAGFSPTLYELQVKLSTDYWDDEENVFKYQTSATKQSVQVSPGINYDFRVKAYNNGISGNYSGTVAQLTNKDTTPPAIPTLVNLVGLDEGLQIVVSTNTETDFLGYKIYIQKSDTEPADITTTYDYLKTTNSTTTVFSGLGLEPGKYYAGVTSYDTSGNESTISNIEATKISPKLVIRTQDDFDDWLTEINVSKPYAPIYDEVIIYNKGSVYEWGTSGTASANEIDIDKNDFTITGIGNPEIERYSSAPTKLFQLKIDDGGITGITYSLKGSHEGRIFIKDKSSSSGIINIIDNVFKTTVASQNFIILMSEETKINFINNKSIGFDEFIRSSNDSNSSFDTGKLVISNNYYEPTDEGYFLFFQYVDYGTTDFVVKNIEIDNNKMINATIYFSVSSTTTGKNIIENISVRNNYCEINTELSVLYRCFFKLASGYSGDTESRHLTITDNRYYYNVTGGSESYYFFYSGDSNYNVLYSVIDNNSGFGNVSGWVTMSSISGTSTGNIINNTNN